MRDDIDVGRLAAIVESSEDAIIAESLSGIVQTWNWGAERLYGYLRAEMIGRPVKMLLPSDRLAEEETILQRIQNGEHVEPFETYRLRLDGSPIDISLAISPIRN